MLEVPHASSLAAAEFAKSMGVAVRKKWATKEPCFSILVCWMAMRLQGDSSMTRNQTLALAFLLAFTISASAQTTVTEYYVVQDVATKKCTIVDKRPTTTTVVQVGPMAFKSRTEAEGGMKTVKVCTTN